ncbi:MAG: SMP-30/gluconolactonase/LRE family protein [Vicinamibacteria bacterium]
MIAVELALAAHAELGEGARWDERSQRLFWVDILQGRVHAFAPADGSCRSWSVGQPVGALGVREAGGLVLALRDGFATLDLGTGALSWIARVEDDRLSQRMNDGRCDAAGRFWAGTMAFDPSPGTGALYRLDAGGRVTTVLSGLTISNGLDWSPDGRALYFVDSGTQRVDLFDFDPVAGALSNRRPFVEVPSAAGMPDGLVVDADGLVWVALWGGGALHRYATDGALAEVVTLPVSHPTSCAFGGPDLQDLYVTSATVELTPAALSRQPYAGGLFRLRPGVAGRAGHRFAG